MPINYLYIKAAFMILTRLPVCDKKQQLKEQHFHACWPVFPLVGLCIGALSSVFLVLSMYLIPSFPACVLVLIATTLLTGAIHEDGFADACDGLFSGKQPEQAFDIMKDSRLGTFGVLGLIFLITLKISILLTLAQYSLVLTCIALLTSHGFARFNPLIIMASLPVYQSTLSKLSNNLAIPSAKQIAILLLAYSTALGLIIIIIERLSFNHMALSFSDTLQSTLLSILIGLTSAGLCKVYLQQKLQSYNGDCLGFSEQLGELAILLSFTLAV